MAVPCRRPAPGTRRWICSPAHRSVRHYLSEAPAGRCPDRRRRGGAIGFDLFQPAGLERHRDRGSGAQGAPWLIRQGARPIRQGAPLLVCPADLQAPARSESQEGEKCAAAGLHGSLPAGGGRCGAGGAKCGLALNRSIWAVAISAGCASGQKRSPPNSACRMDVFAPNFGMTAGRPDPARTARGQAAAAPSRRCCFANSINGARRNAPPSRSAMRRSESLPAQPEPDRTGWTVQAAKRVRDEKALTGRHVLRDFLLDRASVEAPLHCSGRAYHAAPAAA